MTEASPMATSSAPEAAPDGTLLRDPARPKPKYRPRRALHHWNELLKDKEETSHVFRIFDSLPPRGYMDRVRRLVLSEEGERLRRDEPALPPILDDHETLRAMPEGSVAHAYVDFMRREGLSAAGLQAEADKLGRPTYGDLTEWFAHRARDVHDLMHILTGYSRDALGEQCVLLFTHGQQPSHGHLLIGYAGALNIKQMSTGSKAPVMKAVRQAHKTGDKCPPLVDLPIRLLLETQLADARELLRIPEPHWYNKCHRIWREEGIDPYDLMGNKPQEEEAKIAA